MSRPPFLPTGVRTGPPGRDGSNVLPTDEAMRDRIEDPESLTAVALAAAYVQLANRPRSITEFAVGGVLGGAQVNTAIAAVPDGTMLVIPDRVGLIDVGTTPILYQHPVTIRAERGGGFEHSGSPGGAGHRVTASEVTFEGVRFKGPSVGTYVAGQHAITATGTDNGAAAAPTYLTDLLLDDVVIEDWGSDAIRATFVDGLQVVGKSLIRGVGYAGLMGICCDHVDTVGLRIRDVGPGSSSNQYGIQASNMDASSDLVRYPLPKHWNIVGGEVTGLPDWEGIGCHAAYFMNVLGVSFYDVHKPIQFGPGTGTGGDVLHAPKYCQAADIVADSGAATTIRPGFTIAGAQGTGGVGAPAEYAEACSLENITLKGYGPAGDSTLGAIYMRTTRGARIKSVTGVECASSVICLYYDNLGYELDSIKGIDTHSTLAYAPVVQSRSSNNKGSARNLSVTPGTRVAGGGEVQNTHLVYMSSNDAGTRMLLDPNNDDYDVTVAVTGGGGTSKIATKVPPPADVQVFTATGTWTKPAGVEHVRVQLIGAGGGGGSGARRASGGAFSGGGGGAGGGFLEHIFNADDLAATVAVTIAAAGTGGAAISANDTNGNAGGNGGTASFGTLLRATGGGGGAGGNTGAATAGSGGIGQYTSGNGGAGASGAAGAAGSGGFGSPGGGGGGGLASTPAVTAGGNGGATAWGSDGSATAGGSTDGQAGSNGAATTTNQPGRGGGGGASSIVGTGGTGGNGGIYGAGGGGGGASLNGSNSGAGGNGAAGLCVVTAW